MKKSELFKKVYGEIRKVNDSIGKAYQEDTIMAEMDGEEEDLGMPENSATFVNEALEWYSCRLSLELAASITEIFSNFRSFPEVEEDIDLLDPKTVGALADEVDG